MNWMKFLSISRNGSEREMDETYIRQVGTYYISLFYLTDKLIHFSNIY